VSRCPCFLALKTEFFGDAVSLFVAENCCVGRVYAPQQKLGFLLPHNLRSLTIISIRFRFDNLCASPYTKQELNHCDASTGETDHW